MLNSLLVMFAAAPVNCANAAKTTFFGLVPWYHYLTVTNVSTNPQYTVCGVTNFQLLGQGSNSGLLLVLLAIIDDLLRLAGLVSVGYVIYAGIRYVTSQGSPDETAKAQSTLLNALMGLVIALISVGLVSYLGGHLGSTGNGAAPTGANPLDTSSLPSTPATAATLKTVLTIVFNILGALALLFITIGGFRYITSQGDAQAVGKAKGTIIYALVGLVVAILAQVIVTFVMGKV